MQKVYFRLTCVAQKLVYCEPLNRLLNAGIASCRLIYAVSLRVLLFIHFLFWKFGKRIIAQATRDIFKKDLRVHVYSADATTGGKGSETT